jgi:hypothetical protein
LSEADQKAACARMTAHPSTTLTNSGFGWRGYARGLAASGSVLGRRYLAEASQLLLNIPERQRISRYKRTAQRMSVGSSLRGA